MVVTSYEARTKLSELIRRAEAGEIITITRRGVAVAEMTALTPEEIAAIQKSRGTERPAARKPRAKKRR